MKIARWAGFYSDIHSLGLKNTAGMQFVTSWYWDMDAASRKFADAYMKTKRMPGRHPGSRLLGHHQLPQRPCRLPAPWTPTRSVWKPGAALTTSSPRARSALTAASSTTCTSPGQGSPGVQRHLGLLQDRENLVRRARSSPKAESRSARAEGSDALLTRAIPAPLLRLLRPWKFSVYPCQP